MTAAPQTKKNIYVYRDKGVHPGSLKQTLQMLRDFLGSHYLVKTIDAEAVIAGAWIQNTALFVMPGGADTAYAEKLNGPGNAAIKEFVAAGGSYLGICAGSYYGSTYIEFDKAEALEVIGVRELSFFPGKCIGPVLAKYDYTNNSGALAAKILDSSGKTTNLFYNGGGYFENAETHDDTIILGWYQLQDSTLPAIIHTNYENGNVLLSGVHFEYSSHYLQNRNDPFLEVLLPALRSTEAQRKQLIASFFSILRIYC